MGSNETHNTQTVPNETPPSRGRLLALGCAGAVTLAAAAVAALSVFGAPSSASTSAGASTPIQLTVSSPTSGSVIDSDQVTVTGTVSTPGATVTIQDHAAAVGNGVFTGSANLHPGKTTIDVIAAAPGAAPASTTVVVVRPRPPHRHQTPAPVAPVTVIPGPGAASNCGDGLTAGANTTCPFAENVRGAYEQSGPGVVTAYSPVTNATYEMSCSYGPSVVCTGGDNASVYFTTTSSPTYQETSPPASGIRNCGAGLEAGPHTTCPFARNVRSVFESNGPATVDVYSPVTNQTYAMSCRDGSPAVCTGGDEASVYIY